MNAQSILKNKLFFESTQLSICRFESIQVHNSKHFYTILKLHNLTSKKVHNSKRSNSIYTNFKVLNTILSALIQEAFGTII